MQWLSDRAKPEYLTDDFAVGMPPGLGALVPEVDQPVVDQRKIAVVKRGDNGIGDGARLKAPGRRRPDIQYQKVLDTMLCRRAPIELQVVAERNKRISDTAWYMIVKVWSAQQVDDGLIIDQMVMNGPLQCGGGADHRS